MRCRKAIVATIALLPALAWSAASAAWWAGQERLLFKPVPLAADVHRFEAYQQVAAQALAGLR